MKFKDILILSIVIAILTILSIAAYANSVGGGTRPVVTVDNSCGDGYLDSWEQCDDGNKRSNDGCSKYCKIEVINCYSNADCPDSTQVMEPYCIGNNLKEKIEEYYCKYPGTTRSYCTSKTYYETEFCSYGCSENACNPEPCGNGILEVTEECDDGNNLDGDGCSAICEKEPICGDDFLDVGEECDDGNNINGDGCTAECTWEVFCGNGILEVTEECDDGNDQRGDGCYECLITHECSDGFDNDGDGILDLDEDCCFGPEDGAEFMESSDHTQRVTIVQKPSKIKIERLITDNRGKVSPGSFASITATLRNRADVPNEEVYIQLIIEELDLKRRLGPFTIEPGETVEKNLGIFLPLETEIDRYLAKVIIFDGIQERDRNVAFWVR